MMAVQAEMKVLEVHKAENLIFLALMFRSSHIFVFWYFGHFKCAIFFPVFFRLALALQNVSKQRLRNIFVFLRLRRQVTKNEKWNERNN